MVVIGKVAIGIISRRTFLTMDVR